MLHRALKFATARRGFVLRQNHSGNSVARATPFDQFIIVNIVIVRLSFDCILIVL